MFRCVCLLSSVLDGTQRALGMLGEYSTPELHHYPLVLKKKKKELTIFNTSRFPSVASISGHRGWPSESGLGEPIYLP